MCVTDFDAAIVGGGPAGCHAARRLAERGFTVLLAEALEHPRWKPCAGGVTVKAFPYFTPTLKALVERWIYGAHISFGPDHELHVRSARAVGGMVHRESFDQKHFEEVATLEGVTAIAGCRALELGREEGRWRLTTSRGTFKARGLVGADGVKSIVQHVLDDEHDGETRRSVAFEGEVRLARPLLTQDAVFDFRDFSRGYGWVFPKADHYSIGGYIMQPKAPKLRDDYQIFRSESPWLREATEIRTKGYGVPFGGFRTKLQGPSVLLVGDAAEVTDPFTGEGIYYAFRTAELGAEAMSAHLREGAPLNGYSRQVEREIQHDLRWAARLGALLYRAPKTAFSLLTKNPLACRWWVELLRGERSYRQMTRSLALSSPLLLARLLLAKPRVEVIVP